MMKRIAPFSAVLLLVFLFVSSAASAGEGRLDEGKIHQEALALLQAKKYVASVQAYRPLLKAKPLDPVGNYNVACACALLGRTEWALTFLEKSVQGGYIDFEHMLEDPDLESIREEERFRRLYDDREKYLRRAEEKTENEYRRKLGDEYVFLKDEDTRFLLVTNIVEKDRVRFLAMLRNYAAALWRDFFRFKPRITVTVLVPRSWADYSRKFGGRRGAAGFYNHGTRTLTVNRATGGGTLIHEWTHALHYGDQDGLKQRHPTWIVEGFGTLYEQCDIRGDGTAVGLLNWRLAGLQDILREYPWAYLPWKTLMDPKKNVFRADRFTISLAYAEARYIFYYLQDRKVLRKFYRIYRERFKEDPTGARFVAEVLGKPLEEVEAEWKAWVLKLPPEPGPLLRPTLKVRLGVDLQPVEGGVSVAGVVMDSAAARAGLEKGDVIVEAEGRPLRGTRDLQFAMFEKKPGDPFRMKIRRDGETLYITATLAKR